MQARWSGHSRRRALYGAETSTDPLESSEPRPARKMRTASEHAEWRGRKSPCRQQASSRPCSSCSVMHRTVSTSSRSMSSPSRSSTPGQCWAHATAAAVISAVAPGSRRLSSVWPHTALAAARTPCAQNGPSGIRRAEQTATCFSSSSSHERNHPVQNARQWRQGTSIRAHQGAQEWSSIPDTSLGAPLPAPPLPRSAHPARTV